MQHAPAYIAQVDARVTYSFNYLENYDELHCQPEVPVHEERGGPPQADHDGASPRSVIT